MTTPAGVWVLEGGQWLRGTQPAVTPSPSGARFFGDPGAGKVLTGSCVYTDVSSVSDGLAWLNQQTGVKHLLSRRYYTNLWSRSNILADQAAGRVPFPSFKLGATSSNASSILAGSQDAALTAEAQWAASQGFPIMCCFFHEPENNWTSDANAANYRAIFRHVVTIFRNNGATNVNWLPIFVAPWDFTSAAESAHGRWYKWDPDWMGTQSGSNGRATASDWYTGSDAVCSLLGFDQYCPVVNTSYYQEFSTQMGPVLSKIAGDGRTVLPWLVPEMGTTAVTSSPGLPSDGWAGYYERAFQFMRDNSGAGFSSFNCFTAYNFINGTAAAARLAGYEAALGSEAAYLTTVRPS